MATRKHHTHSAGRNFAVSLLVALALTCFKLAFEHTGIGMEAERFIVVLLQRRLVPSYLDAPPAAKVVDLGTVSTEMRQLSDGSTQALTSRDELRAILTEIISHSPRAIALDIDFSYLDKTTGTGGFLVEDDREFFDFCLALSEDHAVPILLGVWRSLTVPGDQWLSDKKYRPLACAIGIPNEEIVTDPHWPHGVPLDPRWGYRWQAAHGSSDWLPSMGQALAHGTASVPQLPPPWWHRFVRPERGIELNESIDARISLVDYGPLRALRSTHIRSADPAHLARYDEEFRGRFVLIGPARRFEALDYFVVPGEPDPVPGVLIHACAALTYAGAPLYELSGGCRLLLDVVLAVVALGSVALVSARYSNASAQSKINLPAVHNLVTLVAVGVVLLVGFVFVRFLRVFWVDSLLVALTLLLHSPAEHSFLHWLPRMRAGFFLPHTRRAR